MTTLKGSKFENHHLEKKRELLDVLLKKLKQLVDDPLTGVRTKKFEDNCVAIEETSYCKKFS